MSPEIPTASKIANRVFSLTNEKEFEQIALDIFHLQFLQNSLYGEYCKKLGKTPHTVFTVEDIPFLPIELFKSHSIKTGLFEPAQVFESSGTTGSTTSRHFVKDIDLYEESFFNCFTRFYGRLDELCIIGLLPSYLERGGSSLVYMVDAMIQKSNHPASGFYLHDHSTLKNVLQQLEAGAQKTILFGVTYALLHFAENHGFPLRHTTLIETGGMKGRKKELLKEELYTLLRDAFSLPEIHSEYGMTELLSQAYAINGRYVCPPWMKITLRDVTDPFTLGQPSGAINVVDLANIWSCSFIATEDLGRQHPDGSFEVLGRMDNTDIRGCSQLTL